MERCQGCGVRPTRAGNLEVSGYKMPAEALEA
jgi:hypothetical protein